MSAQVPPMTVKTGPNVADAVLVGYGRRALETELAGLSRLRDRPDASFGAACRGLLACQGRVVVTGMGKSGHVAGKIASTLASTGTPAFFLHPGEAGHGDLGMITRQDVLLALSNSGATAEVLTLLPQLKRLGVPLIALTGRLDSPLAQTADVTIDADGEHDRSAGHGRCPRGGGAGGSWLFGRGLRPLPSGRQSRPALAAAG